MDIRLKDVPRGEANRAFNIALSLNPRHPAWPSRPGARHGFVQHTAGHPALLFYRTAKGCVVVRSANPA